MVEFSAAAELDVGIAPGALQDARRQIENELGDVTVGVSGSAAPSGQPRDPATGQFASPMGSEEYERRDLSLGEDRNALLEDIADAMDDVVGGGFGGGGGVPGGGGGGGGGRGGLLSLLGGGVGGAGVAGAGVLGGALAGAGGLLAGADLAGRRGFQELNQRFPEAGGTILGTQAGRQFATSPVASTLAGGGPTGLISTGSQIAGQALINELSNVDIQTPQWVNDLTGWDPPSIQIETPPGQRANVDAMGATSTERAILAGRPQERDPRLTGQNIGFQGVNVEVNVGDNGGSSRQDAERVARREADRMARRLLRELEQDTPGAGTGPRTFG